ncbi:histidine kinase [Mobilitalea sibirica]|uniref:Histidine kinase n=1 Tax=Mobilitalea sibirica TaxID=1462919 RepID=A0A8J7L0F4_9FIRM|nr:histidine kinase [Mobilitalea sibirica]MBH1942243.1 histidine kinase [Mobilitalea sibirica]
MKTKMKKGSIRLRLVLIFTFTTCVVFFVNMFMYYNINRSIQTIDEVYVSNVELNELLDALTDVQDYVYEYLTTKSTDALENYYRSEQTYQNMVTGLSSDITDNHMMIMQKNIKNISESYLTIIDETVDANRGRNIERIKINYEKATTLYEYIKTNINSLNNELFQYNSNNYELLLTSLRYLEIISTVVLLVISLFNVILIIVVTRSITGPLMKLTEAANEVAAGNFEVDLVQVDSSDEVEIVTKAFNTMTVSIHQYILKTKESMELESRMKEKELMMTNHLKDAQLKYLQAQINPHFLFNTLNAGAQLAMMEGADKTCLFIENMADFFRFNMKSFVQDSTLRDEIKLVDSYIYILNVRFSGEIHFNKDIDESLLDVVVPSMILQPVVENAVNYGIRNIEYEGIINMEIYEDADNINISITDNGIGMDATTIDRIMHLKIEERAVPKERTLTKDSNGIGLGNVINRLRLYYDREDVFEIKSEGQNMGTQVIIHIPKYGTKTGDLDE